MQYILVFYTALYLFGVAALLWVTHYKRKHYTLAKGGTSLLFFGGSVLAFWLGTGAVSAGFLLLLTALLLCMGGDILLGLANRTKTVRAKPFAGGAFSFLLAHIFFCLLLYSRVPPSGFDLLLPLLLVGVLFLLGRADLVRLKKMWPLGYSYTFIVGLMACKAVQAATLLWQTAPLAGLLIGGGGILFLVSDIILLFLYFGTTRRKWMRYANLSTYYLGIYCIAITAYWL